MTAIKRAVGLPWSPAAPAIPRSMEVAWETPTPRDRGATVTWSPATPVTPRSVDVVWESTLPRDQRLDIPWAPASIVTPIPITTLWDTTTPRDRGVDIPWSPASIVTPIPITTPWEVTTPRDRKTVMPWEIPPAKDRPVTTPWHPATPLDRSVVILWVERSPAHRKISTPWKIPPHIVRPVRLVWRGLYGSIIRMPDLTLTRVDTQQNIPLLRGSAAIDLDSWCWRISATLASRGGMDLVRPTASGPVEVELSINGYSWRMLVEEIRQDRSFAAGGWQISGRSPSCQLAAPYAPLQTRQWGLLSARQIVAGELSGSGWAEEWHITDWSIPADLFSVTDQSSMQIITTIAQACGGVVQTHRSDPSLIVQHRYPVSPKEWATTSPAATLSDATLFSQSESWSPGPGYDAVVVSGQDQGVLVTALRSGAPGITHAPSVVDPLILNTTVARDRARSILDQDGYDRSIYTRTMPLATNPAEPGLRLPGELVEIEEPLETWRGQVSGVSVSAGVGGGGALTVSQTLTIERVYT
ncbi:MAG: hypothetical protein HQL52_03935 [Magnetococcales bacterium]|nr:hypothetical protein [Magnetococcales bacterium]